MPSDHPLLRVGRWLRDQGYRFVTVTPATHARVNEREHGVAARSLADVFGWSRPFPPSLLPAPVVQMLREADVLEHRGELIASRVRFSTLDEQLYVHSAFPTVAADAVFFGPDTYRFAAFIKHELEAFPPTDAARVLDVGCGTGAGGFVAVRALPGPSSLTLTDINAAALTCARINADLAGIPATFRQCDLFDGVGPFDVIVANPPYIADPKRRAYRDGGGDLGTGLSLRIVREGIEALAPGGALVLYTGSPIVRGQDRLRAAIEAAARTAGAGFDYRELDPDVFGEELDSPFYAEVDRIAAVGVVLRRGR